MVKARRQILPDVLCRRHGEPHLCHGRLHCTSPLGPFTPQKRNPFFRNTDGLVTGTGHGCDRGRAGGPTLDDLHGSRRRGAWLRASPRAWTAWKLTRTANSMFRLRPRCRSGCRERFPQDKNPPTPGWLPINGGMPAFGSSSAPNLLGRFAVDNELRTWWQPAADDSHPMLTSQFYGSGDDSRRACRSGGTSASTRNRGVMPGPFRYRVELDTARNQWTDDSRPQRKQRRPAHRLP